ncbi:High-affinity choline transport protein [Salinisphaera shabanensis E1L3A]|uniref:High-affinity choline transport protein n=1 Tax=Salinisphaera shabanensis E1L3A TaxID=1033802 RepID=U2E5U7_9GAMM|nr:choline BCCT transporter BetT [Salinisphaera shabanensis]ERJ19151.1 High-affinity choline transport protein [Salinisphaera shabanensis E1L3A]
MSDSQPTKAGINPPVFFPSVAVIGVLVVFGAVFPEKANTFFSGMQSWLISTFGWLYLGAVGAYLIFCIVLALSRYGQFRLGPDHSEPDFSYISWFAMLFSAGMGIGLMFYGVAEPVMHYANPPQGTSETAEAARSAMRITFFHWGMHAWAIYAVVGLCLAYFSFRRDLPLRMSSALYPLIGKRISGPIGNAVDILAVFGTLFGVATSLGFGAQQVNSGLNFLFSVPEGLSTQIVLICIITAMATTSVVLGLDGGIRRVSELNLWLAAALLLFVIVMGPTLFIFQSLIQNIGNYMSSVVDMTFNSWVYTGNDDTETFMSSWTLFYWAWWISWSPFVGMFVARVSRGRTIREFVLGVLLVPVGATFLWLTAFGDGALHMIMIDGMTTVLDAVDENTSTALFVFLEQFPFTWLTSILGTMLVITFFVTSSDSGSLVIDILTAKDGDEPPVWQRIFWAVLEGLVAIVLLAAGGIGALQAASLASALPITVIILIMAYCLYRSLSIELVKQDSLRHAMNTPSNVAGFGGGSWENRLKTLVTSPRRKQVDEFLTQVVKPAMEAVSKQFEESGMSTKISVEDDRCYLDVDHGAEIDFVYGVRARRFTAPTFYMGALTRSEEQKKAKEREHFRAEVFLREGGQQYNVVGYTKEQLIGDILDQYEKHLHFLYLVR